MRIFSPYRIEVLSQDPDKPILVVEGEKTADAAQKLLPEYQVLTWGGGAGNVDKTNWQCLIGKTVVIWPDYDYNQSGQEAAQKLQRILIQLNKIVGKESCIGIVDLLEHIPVPHYLPDKWDLADQLPNDWTVDTVRQIIQVAKAQEIGLELAAKDTSLVTASPNTDSRSTIDLAAKEFVSLTEQYEQTPWKDPQRQKIRESLDKLVSIHWRNNEFISKIENSGSKAAASNIKIEIHLQEVELSHSRHQLDR